MLVLGLRQRKRRVKKGKKESKKEQTRLVWWQYLQEGGLHAGVGQGLQQLGHGHKVSHDFGRQVVVLLTCSPHQQV
jgi:hypothetical protein